MECGGNRRQQAAPGGLHARGATPEVTTRSNGLLVLSDGSIVTKDLRRAGQGRSTITRLHPDELALLGDPLVLPEGSMGRIDADIDAAGNEFIYIPGIERVWRMLVGKDRLELDES